METWYVLETGEVAHPRDIKRNATGVLVHKDGRKVDYAPHGPRSRSVDPDAERAAAERIKAARKAEADAEKAAEKAAEAEKAMPVLDPDDAPATVTRDLTAERPRRGYRTRSGS